MTTAEASDTRYLVYRGNGYREYQPIEDFPEVGNCVDGDTDEELELIGWSDRHGGSVKTSDMWLEYVDKRGKKHYQHWRDTIEMGGLIEEDDGEDMELGVSTEDKSVVDNTPQTFPLSPSDKYLMIPDLDPYKRTGTLTLEAVPGIRDEEVTIFEPREDLIKLNHVKGELKTLQKFDWQKKDWGSHMSPKGEGQEYLLELQDIAPEVRKVSPSLASAYGQCSQSCLSCGTHLSGKESLRKGIGPECEKKGSAS